MIVVHAMKCGELCFDLTLLDPSALVSVQSVLIQNIAPSVTSDDLKRVFLQCGPVSRVSLIESTGTSTDSMKRISISITISSSIPDLICVLFIF